MGRAQNNYAAVAVATRGSDEIQSLADSELKAENLDDLAGVAARAADGGGYGNDADERAVTNLIANLRRTPSARSLSVEALTEKAEDLYALFCRQIASGATDEQLAKIASLVGEDAAKLRERLS